jgi:hypothetical protein
MDNRKFTSKDVWNGGFYELALEIGERSDDKLFAVLQAVWSHPFLDGCYLQKDKEPRDQQRIVPNLRHIASGFHLLGIATLPNTLKVACGTIPIREDDGLDWLSLYIPMGALSSAYAVGGYPFDEGKGKDWRVPLEDWFAEIGETVYQTAKFQLGLIGLEVSGETDSKEVATNGIPQDRITAYLWVENDRLRYYPTTIW